MYAYYLVPPHGDNPLVVQNHVVSSSVLVGIVNSPLEHGAVYHAYRTGPEDAHRITSFEAVAMAHMGTVVIGHAARQQTSVRHSRLNTGAL